MKSLRLWGLFENAFAPVIHRSSKISLELLKGGRVKRQRRRKRWLWLKVTHDHKLLFYWVICSSFTTCGECCRLTGLITLFLVNVKVWKTEAPCCCKMEELLHSSVRAHTKHDSISIQTSLRVSDTPWTELSASLCCTQTPPPTAEPLCSLWMILPQCTTASSFDCLPCAHSAPSHPR